MRDSKFQLKPEATIWAIKGAVNRDVDLMRDQYEGLREGEGRFGWGHVRTGDMRDLAEKVRKNGWSALNSDEEECWNPFWLEIKADDWLVYVNVPESGRCTLARVTRPYYFGFDEQVGDLGHRFGVDRDTVRTFDRNASVVHPHLSARLKLQSRKWRIGAREEFAELLTKLESSSDSHFGRPITANDNRGRLCDEITPELRRIVKTVHRTHPNRDLEALLVHVFENMPGVKEVEWIPTRNEKGADLILHCTAGLPFGPLQREEICLVQVKSYEGTISDKRSVDDLRSAFRDE